MRQGGLSYINNRRTIILTIENVERVYLVKTEHGLSNGETVFTYAVYKSQVKAQLEQLTQIDKNGALESKLLSIPFYKDE
jgi:hypothetical protein